jgi:hypothetical protein
MNRAVYVILSDDKQKHPFSHQRDVPAAYYSFARLAFRHKRLSINALWYSAHAEPITHVLGEGAEDWKRRVINIAGNHDVGYAGALTAERFERFERVFGWANYELLDTMERKEKRGGRCQS